MSGVRRDSGEDPVKEINILNEPVTSIKLIGRLYRPSVPKSKRRRGCVHPEIGDEIKTGTVTPISKCYVCPSSSGT